MIAAASVLVLYGGLTLGAQAVSAIGVGVAKPPKHADHTAYVGVRLDHTQLTDDVLLDADPRHGHLGRRRRAGRHPPLGRARGPRRPGRRHRQRRLGQGLVPALEPRPQRRRQGRQDHRRARPARRPASSAPAVASTRSTSTTRTARSRSSWSPTSPCGPRACPRRLQAGKVYVLDGRDRDPTAMEVAVADLHAQFESAGLRAAPLGELR